MTAAFLASVCYNRLNAIAKALENPFGEDADDLPLIENHTKGLQIVTSPPDTNTPPRPDTGLCMFVSVRVVSI